MEDLADVALALLDVAEKLKAALGKPSDYYLDDRSLDLTKLLGSAERLIAAERALAALEALKF